MVSNNFSNFNNSTSHNSNLPVTNSTGNEIVVNGSWTGWNVRATLQTMSSSLFSSMISTGREAAESLISRVGVYNSTSTSTGQQDQIAMGDPPEQIERRKKAEIKIRNLISFGSSEINLRSSEEPFFGNTSRFLSGIKDQLLGLGDEDLSTALEKGMIRNTLNILVDTRILEKLKDETIFKIKNIIKKSMYDNFGIIMDPFKFKGPDEAQKKFSLHHHHNKEAGLAFLQRVALTGPDVAFKHLVSGCLDSVYRTPRDKNSELISVASRLVRDNPGRALEIVNLIPLEEFKTGNQLSSCVGLRQYQTFDVAKKFLLKEIALEFSSRNDVNRAIEIASLIQDETFKNMVLVDIASKRPALESFDDNGMRSTT